MTRIGLLTGIAIVTLVTAGPGAPVGRGAFGVRPALAQSPTPMLTLMDSSGAVVGSIRGEGDRLTVHDETGKPVARLKVENDRVKLRDLQDGDRWKVKRKDNGAEVEDGGGRRLYRIRRSGDLWKLEDAGKRPVGTLKVMPGGIELRDMSGRTTDLLPLVERAALWAYFARVHK